MEDNKREVLEGLTEYLQNMIGTMPFIIKAYRNVDREKITEYTLPLLDGMQWINDAVVATKDVTGLDISENLDLYSEFMDSIENNDTTLTADLLEFEFTPKFEEYIEAIENSLK